MSLILCIETATSVCSVSLSKGGEVIALREINEEKAHASQITVFVSEVLEKSGFSIKNLDAVAVSKGPGSYTGLRIGVSASKGICYGLEIPLISVDTLYSMALGFLEFHNDFIQNLYSENILLCPMIDAMRMEVYNQLVDLKQQTIRKTQAEIIDENSFSEYFKTHKVIFFGSGADKCKDIITNKNAYFFPSFLNSAKFLSKFAFQKFQSQQFENTAYFEPFYLKDFVAKVKQNKE
ncbi:MAG: tRNA (adenosine(37)-N6)-threonylcarbamoyltransferase complex dimerization subunit type 1 TsaB [Bacteroidetes bacterium GWA2_31_9]|nr:MAG: tRNA (adenosine(37)-N6)-threonylcarbamoyltransferase complex dimerization subunit type 1 TsaB [Bacteroidetes bacterium GWA2_31_9]